MITGILFLLWQMQFDMIQKDSKIKNKTSYTISKTCNYNNNVF